MHVVLIITNKYIAFFKNLIFEKEICKFILKKDIIPAI